MFCIKCGAENADGNKFCIKCGAPLPAVGSIKPADKPAQPEPAKPESSGDSTQAAPQAQPQQPEQPKPVTPAPVPQQPVQQQPTPQGQQPVQPQPTPQAQQPQAQPQPTPQQPQAQPTPQAQQQPTPQAQQQPQGAGNVTDNAKAFAQNAKANFHKQVPGFGELVKLGFKDPIGAMKFGKERKLAKEGLLIILIKDLIVSLLTVFQAQSTVSRATSALPISNPLAAQNGIAVFIGMLFIMIAIDVISCFILFGISKAFGGKSDLPSWLGALGASNVLTGTCAAIGSLFAAMNLLPIGLIVSVFAVIVGIVVDVKLVEDCMDLHGNRLIYSIVVSVVLIAIAVMILFAIIGAVFGAAAFTNGMNSIEQYGSDFDDYGDFDY